MLLWVDHSAEIFWWNCFYVLVCIGIGVIILLRDKPGFDTMYKVLKLFVIYILVKLSINFLKKELKEWWEKD